MSKEVIYEEHHDTYICDCGCNIEFWNYSLGWDMHFIHNGIYIDKLFTESKMVNTSWNNHIDIDLYESWGDLWIYICNNRNLSNVMRHLYDRYRNSNIPLDAIISLDYIN